MIIVLSLAGTTVSLQQTTGVPLLPGLQQRRVTVCPYPAGRELGTETADARTTVRPSTKKSEMATAVPRPDAKQQAELDPQLIAAA